jgi:hypothetical protein
VHATAGEYPCKANPITNERVILGSANKGNAVGTPSTARVATPLPNARQLSPRTFADSHRWYSVPKVDSHPTPAGGRWIRTRGPPSEPNLGLMLLRSRTDGGVNGIFRHRSKSRPRRVRIRIRPLHRFRDPVDPRYGRLGRAMPAWPNSSGRLPRLQS